MRADNDLHRATEPSPFTAWEIAVGIAAFVAILTIYFWACILGAEVCK